MALLLVVLPGALAEEEPTVYNSGDYEYILLPDGTVEITGYFGDAEELIIPAERDGRRVTAIGDAAFPLRLLLTSVTIPEGVTAIGSNAFSESFNLTSIILPQSLVSIGDLAFYGCGSLVSITLPDSVAVVGDNPFCDCYHLAAIIVSPDHPVLEVVDGVLFDNVEKRLVSYPFTLAAEGYSVPQGTQIIGDYAFASNVSLRSVCIPDSVMLIDPDAFFACGTLCIEAAQGSCAATWCADHGFGISGDD